MRLPTVSEVFHETSASAGSPGAAPGTARAVASSVIRSACSAPESAQAPAVSCARSYRSLAMVQPDGLSPPAKTMSVVSGGPPKEA